MADARLPGRALVTRRAIREIVERAAAASYGVVAVGRLDPLSRLLRALGLATPGISVELGPPLRAEVSLTVAYGVPVAEVARNVEEAVRHEVRQALGRELDGLVIHVDDLRRVRLREGG
jgi:uncharacterized alkaline shock family protein YloU